MSRLEQPSILIALGNAGENGIPMSNEPWFRNELELCSEWGFQLEFANNRVSLKFDQDQLAPHWIQRETPAIAWDWLTICGFLCIESTNDEALIAAGQGSPGGTLVYAEQQVAGKGRSGRTWFSPARTGLYFTLLLKPTRPAAFWPLLTHMASVALAEALSDLSEQGIIPQALDIDIKWPNDVLLSGKKCAGILLETRTAEGGNHAAAIGIGVNVHPGSVPESLVAEAACLDDMAHSFVPRRLLLVRILHHLQLRFLMFERGQHAELLEKWKSMSSMWHGSRIWITRGNLRQPAETCGLNEIGALLVRMEDGSRETLLAGDVSVRRE
jgi:BirA family transcriptional regulator, biotin operon repressor / biotin---[acetyl-CoA-carboxylase] ligase